MNTKILTFGALTLTAVSAHAVTNIVAGWDFSDVAALNDQVSGYEAERFSFNNGVTTTGTLILDGTAGSSNLVQDTEVFFGANGNASGQPQFNDGFDQTTTDGFGGVETGQQSLNFRVPSGSFDLVINFSSAYDVVINADWLSEVTGGATDILDVSWSTDGITYSEPLQVGDSDYAALANNSAWVESTGNAGGFIGFANPGQSDMVIDLSAETVGVANAISYVKLSFSGLGANERFALDNIHVAGTAVPESALNGSLFILENADSDMLIEDWYATPMGDLYIGLSPWLYSNDYGWFFSGADNTLDEAYVYIEAAPFQTWVFVDQDTASSLGFWGYSYNASNSALDGWFWFFNPESTADLGRYFIWDNEGQEVLIFDDQAQ